MQPADCQVSVSYTHLDVYKRQGVHIPAFADPGYVSVTSITEKLPTWELFLCLVKLFRGVIDDDALVQQLLYGGVGMDPGAEDIDLDEVVAIGQDVDIGDIVIIQRDVIQMWAIGKAGDCLLYTSRCV